MGSRPLQSDCSARTTAFPPVRDFATLLEERVKRAKAVEAGEILEPKMIEGDANSSPAKRCRIGGIGEHKDVVYLAPRFWQ